METIDILLKLYSDLLQGFMKNDQETAAKFKEAKYDWGEGYFSGKVSAYQLALDFIKDLISQREKDKKNK